MPVAVRTFGKWAVDMLGGVDILDRESGARLLRRFTAPLPGEDEFLIEEVEYLLSRFEPGNLAEYLSARRGGRGIAPRVEHTLRRQLLADVVAPYVAEKARPGVLDWNDIAVAAGQVDDVPPWDVVIVDKAQDFSANQIRTIFSHRAGDSSVTFIMDAAQRIYPRFFTWKEAGISAFVKKHTLRRNHRNTRQIAAFARPLVEGLPLEIDGTLPDFEACAADGPVPLVLAGKYRAQIDHIIDHLHRTMDLTSESVVHPDLPKLVPLAAKHDVSSFNCGKPELDKWLSDYALASHQADLTRTWVLIEDDRVIDESAELSISGGAKTDLVADLRSTASLRVWAHRATTS